MRKELPSNFKPLLWSKSFKKIDPEQDRVYIIHQILSYGGLKEVRQLFGIYTPKKIKETFINYPKKVYSPAVFYFIKLFILGLKDKPLKEEDYVKTPF